MVLTLFIQTYATQVQEMVKKNGQTPENFRPSHNMKPQEENDSNLHQLHNILSVGSGGTMLHELGKVAPISLDILSYAASFRGSQSASPSSPLAAPVNNGNPPQRSTETDNGAEDKKSNGFNTTNDVATSASLMSNNPTSSSRTPAPIPAPIPTPVIGPISNTRYSLPSGYPLINDPTKAHMFPTVTNQMPNMTQVFENGSRPSQLGLSNNVPYIPGGRNSISHNIALANPDQLESSFLALNDEFWVDLLRSDQDKINFSNNISSQTNDELFYM